MALLEAARRSAPGAPLTDAVKLAVKQAVLAEAAAKKQAPNANADADQPFTLTNEVLLFLNPGADPVAVGRDLQIEPLRSATAQPDIWIFRAGSVDAALKARAAAARDPRVATALINRKVHPSRYFIPNDPYYPPNTPVAGWPGQWHLKRANLEPIWAEEVTGAGVLLAIQDDELEFTHPDLAGNFSAANSLNFGVSPGDSNYGPNTAFDHTNNEDRHGTCVGGVAAAVGGNGIGGTGAAPHSGLAINRIDFNGNQGEAEFVAGVLYHSDGNNNSIKVKNHSYGFQNSYIDDSGENSAVSTSMTAGGTIHVYAAANSRGSGVAEDSNFLMPQNNPDLICVAALGSDDKFAFYSNYGACVFVTAPSSSGAGTNGITTTDRSGTVGYNPVVEYADPANGIPTEVDDTYPDQAYTSTFGGTSSAAPLVSGILALGKQANPAMTLRMAQHALVRSSNLAANIVDPTDSTVTGGGDGVTAGSAWKTNNAGFKFNQNYGFGIVDATHFVKEVVKYSGVNEIAPEVHSANFNVGIPDNSPAGPIQTFTVTGTTPLESIQVGLNLTHTYRGDLEAFVTSPKGTVCRLMAPAPADAGPLPDPGWLGIAYWTFSSLAFWGENPAGTWKIQVIDTAPVDTGSWLGYVFTAHMGTPVINTTPPTVLSINTAMPTPTNANPLTFTVTFSEYVTGVDVTDFTLTTTGSIAGASITSVTGGCNTYTVTVNPGTGAGTITLNLIDNDSIVDGAGNKLGGTGVGNGNFTTGQAYSFDSTPATISVTSTTPNGDYTQGQQVNVTLNFSKALTLTGGNLHITLDTGSVLTLTPFTNQTSVGATYTVVAGQISSALTVVSPLALTAGTLRDVFGNDALLTIAPASDLPATKTIVIDASAPTGGVVLDGLSGPDISTQTSLTTISAHWSGFADLGTGIAGYRWCIGTGPGRSDLLPFTDVGLATVASTSFANENVILEVGVTYYVTVEARDGAGNKGLAASNGVQVVAGGSAIIPLPPARLDALALPTSVQLIWIPSPTVGVTGYRLWWKPSASPWTSATLVDNLVGTTTTVSGLTLGTPYDFQLRALMPGGNESSSVFASATPIHAITVNGAGNYGTIQAAITAATSGQTVTVQAGSYSENLTLSGGVTLTGVSPVYTILSAPSGDVITSAVTSTASTVSQLTVTGGAVGINAGTSPLTIRNVVIHHTGSSGVHSGASASLLQVINCTIAHCGALGIDAGGTTTVRNVIAEGNAGIGISAPAAASVTYSDSYGNSASFAGGFSQGTDYTMPVLFTNEAANDYTEMTGSPSIDAGDPNDAFDLEPAYNGGRINLGAYGDTPFAATSPTPSIGGGGGGGGGGCGLSGLESVLLLALVRRVKRKARV